MADEAQNVYTATITMTGYALSSLERAQAAVNAILDDLLPPKKGFEVTIKMKSEFNFNDELRSIEELARTHRGVKFNIKSEVKKEIVPVDGAVDWQDTPLGMLATADSDEG